jgi:hypothetical protein
VTPRVTGSGTAPRRRTGRHVEPVAHPLLGDGEDGIGGVEPEVPRQQEDVALVLADPVGQDLQRQEHLGRRHHAA